MKATLRTWLLTKASLTGLVGTRIYTGRAPRDAALPYLLITRIAGASWTTHAGMSGACSETWQFDVWAQADASAEAVKEAVRLLLTGKRITLTGFTLENAQLELVADSVETDGDGSENTLSRRIMQYRTTRTESVA
jgi:hypothetical protein